MTTLQYLSSRCRMGAVSTNSACKSPPLTLEAQRAKSASKSCSDRFPYNQPQHQPPPSPSPPISLDLQFGDAVGLPGLAKAMIDGMRGALSLEDRASGDGTGGCR